MTQLLWICLGGAFGTGARYLISAWSFERFGASFPLGTFLVNVIGSFLLVFLIHLGAINKNISPKLIQILGTGVMGGFTTYSTFNYEVLRYTQQDNYLLGALYILLTITTCLIAGFLGLTLARSLVG